MNSVEGNVDDINDKATVGDFQKEQKKIVEQHTKKSESVVPPWVESNDAEII